MDFELLSSFANGTSQQVFATTPLAFDHMHDLLWVGSDAVSVCVCE